MHFRARSLLVTCASALALGGLNCSETGSPPMQASGGAPSTGGHASGGAAGNGGTAGGTAGSGGGQVPSTGGTGSGGPGNGGAGGASSGGTGGGGTTATGGKTSTGASGGASATGGTSSNGGTTGSGGTAGADAGNGTGGRTGTGGATSGNDGSADGPADSAAEASRDGATDDPGKDVSMADKPQADTSPDSAASSTCNLSGSATSATPTVYVIGDSTASIYASDLFPRMGWAQPLQDFFAPACATIADKALSGRSSKSFYDEGNWTPIKSALRKGDFVLIQFGHNDEKTDAAARGTDPSTTFKQYLSYYIDDALAKGAIPILLTPINRNNWSGGALKDTHGAYPGAMRELAVAKKISLVDATALTKTYFERIGEAATAKLFLILAAGEYPNYPDGNTDNTHLQEKGARIIAQMVLADLYRQALPPGTLAKTIPQAP
jgi:lysophospholipase L1-like esterase